MIEIGIRNNEVLKFFETETKNTPFYVFMKIKGILNLFVLRGESSL